MSLAAFLTVIVAAGTFALLADSPTEGGAAALRDTTPADVGLTSGVPTEAAGEVPPAGLMTEGSTEAEGGKIAATLSDGWARRDELHAEVQAERDADAAADEAALAAEIAALSTTTTLLPLVSEAQTESDGTAGTPLAVTAPPTTVPTFIPVPAPVPLVTNGVWDQIAACEASGNWSTNTGNGYFGGLQFLLSTWQNNGGGIYAPYPHQASREQQIAIAERVVAAAGGSYRAWGACAARLGLP